MSRDEKARAKRAKILFFIVKYANLWGFCCRRRRGCLKLPIDKRKTSNNKNTNCFRSLPQVYGYFFGGREELILVGFLVG